MAIIRATVVLNKKSGIPADASRNVWHFSADDTDATTLAQIADGLEDFYNAIATKLGNSVATTAGAHRVELAEVGFDSVSPILATVAFATPLVPSTSFQLPNEVAICLSFRAAIDGVPEEEGLTRPRSRRRGRVFLGPLHSSVVFSEATTQDPVVDVSVRELILDAYDTAHDQWDFGTLNIRHTVFSRTDGNNRIVEQVSVDNEFDTQRRRGQKPTLRMSRSVGATAVLGRSGTDVALAT